MRAIFSAVLAWALISAMAQAADEAKKEAPVVPPREGKSETIKLFNGRNLDGWEGHDNLWSVRDGVIVAKNTDPIKVTPNEVKDLLYRDIYEKKLRLAMAERFETMRGAAQIDNYLTGSSQQPKSQMAARPALPNATTAPLQRR